MKRLSSTKIETSCVCRHLAASGNGRGNFDVGGSYFEEKVPLCL